MVVAVVVQELFYQQEKMVDLVAVVRADLAEALGMSRVYLRAKEIMEVTQAQVGLVVEVEPVRLEQY